MSPEEPILLKKETDRKGGREGGGHSLRGWPSWSLALRGGLAGQVGSCLDGNEPSRRFEQMESHGGGTFRKAALLNDVSDCGLE